MKLAATLPLLSMQLKQPVPVRFNFIAEEYAGGVDLVFGNDAETLLRRARMAASFFTFLLAMLVCAAGYEMFGPAVALLALALFAFEPTVLAHGALVTTDMGAACFTFAAVYAFYRFLKRPGLVRLVVCGLAVGLALASKVSGVLALPILALLAVADVVMTAPLITSETGSGRGKRAGMLAASWLGIAAISYFVLWSFYTFRYAARPSGLVMGPTFAQLLQMIPQAGRASMLRHLAAWHLLPEAYLFGWAKLYSGITAVPAFLLGHIYPDGTWLYFPVTFVIKSSLALLILLVASLFFLRRFSREALTLWIAFAVILMACMTESLNIGVRHALALYPFAILLAAGAAWTIAKTSRAAAYAVAALLIFQCISSLHAYPNYLPYANEAFGGPSKTYKVLTDSNGGLGTAAEGSECVGGVPSLFRLLAGLQQYCE